MCSPRRFIATLTSLALLASPIGCTSEPAPEPPTRADAEAALTQSREAQERTLEKLAERTVDYLKTGWVEREFGPGYVLQCKPAAGGIGAVTFARALVHFPDGMDLQGFLVQLDGEYRTREGWVSELLPSSQKLWLNLWSPDGTEFHVRQNINWVENGESRFAISSFGACISVPKDFDMYAQL